MNRKSKIIVSVVGITIVLLALLGITYAYYLTRIEGNTNTNSISVSTADLKLKYGDGNGLISKSDIMPGTTITKDFTVTNSGKSKISGYLVVLEQVHNTLTRKEDLVYTLTCKLQDNTNCGNVTETIYPTNSLSVIFVNDIDVDVTHYYTLTVTYKNLENIDQSEDMGRKFDGRINIMDANTNPYKTGVTAVDDKNLAYNIINNSMTGTNGTKIVSGDLVYSQDYEDNFIQTSGLTSGDGGMSEGTYITYANDFEFDSKKGFTLKNIMKCKVDECGDLEGKYVPYSFYYYYASYSDEFTFTSEMSFVEIYRIDNFKVTTGVDWDPEDNSYQGVEIELTKYLLLKKGLSYINSINDLYGTSYYFLGNVQDNWVWFNNMCFRAVRVEGDGSVKLIYSGTTVNNQKVCNSMSSTHPYVLDAEEQIAFVPYGNNGSLADYNNYQGGLKTTLERWFNTYFKNGTELNQAGAKVKEDRWCFGTHDNYKYDYDGSLLDPSETVGSYSAAGIRYRNNEQNLMCENEEYILSRVGALTYDEVSLAGVPNTTSSQYNNYLYHNINNNDPKYWLLTRTGHYVMGYAAVLHMDDKKITDTDLESNPSLAVRPSITLLSGVNIESGVGTKDSPYVVNNN